MTDLNAVMTEIKQEVKKLKSAGNIFQTYQNTAERIDSWSKALEAAVNDRIKGEHGISVNIQNVVKELGKVLEQLKNNSDLYTKAIGELPSKYEKLEKALSSTIELQQPIEKINAEAEKLAGEIASTNRIIKEVHDAFKEVRGGQMELLQASQNGLKEVHADLAKAESALKKLQSDTVHLNSEVVATHSAVVDIKAVASKTQDHAQKALTRLDQLEESLQSHFKPLSVSLENGQKSLSDKLESIISSQSSMSTTTIEKTAIIESKLSDLRAQSQATRTIVIAISLIQTTAIAVALVKLFGLI